MRTWAGTKPYTVKGPSTKTSANDGKDQEETQETSEAPATLPIKGSHFKDGVQLCLKHGSSRNWLEDSVSVNSNKSGQTCPAGLVKCSEKARETICVKQENLDTECPITAIALVPNSEVNSVIYKDYKKAIVEPSA